ncbi:MAG TPA: hypothetical protein VKA82_04420 [Rubrobacter sp.]|nr:hypothetical protein [Rubrobacter sp.]
MPAPTSEVPGVPSALARANVGHVDRGANALAPLPSPPLLVGVAFGFVPYVLSALWIVATSIVLIRRAGGRPLAEKTHRSEKPLRRTRCLD